MHMLDPELLRRPVRVLVVGCGGSGSAIASGLPYLHQAMLVAGHPGGLHATIWTATSSPQRIASASLSAHRRSGWPRLS